ncbi:iron complex outermembrane recepter protein [Lutibacter oricola]|uniref:Iron complex outermembrane recepter protein n=1 Tax=Lutibacter oricola TaxID=762486 RepID=A0A1H3FXD2_9FLAO|nr:TonB-dependent receptor [Lutibacter oricola]SDX94789.1 iron complex outermembrane recepter protein [Lutibacter oricola]
MKFSNKIVLFLVIAFTSVFSFKTAAQKNKVYNQMTLDELLDIDVVVTASKKPEDLFETPLSTTIIKKEEIEKSGVTSIPEALRLAQGVIVREITPGNFDVHIRGYDNITKNIYLKQPYNTTTLVMIDYRVVYSYFSGGTLWESFPIDLNDVERIEVVRGPASALYGPNAVTGVINIITSHANKKGKNINVNSKFGTNQAKKATVNVGYNWNGKTKLSFSGNFNERKRFDTKYYDFNKKAYTNIDELSLTVQPIKDVVTNESWNFKDYQKELGAYYDEDLSLRKIGGNIFFLHNFSEQSNIDIAVGAQKAQSQKSGYLNLATVLSEYESESFYVNSRFKHKNINGQFSVNSGHNYSNHKFNSYKFTTVEGSLEYNKQFKSFSVRPGVGYKYLSYNSPLTYKEPSNFGELNYQFKDEARVANVYSAFVLSEWKPTSKLRLIGAARMDKFNINKNWFANYEVAGTYRLNKNNLLRAVYSRANKSPFFFDSYLNTSIYLNYDVPTGDGTTYLSVPSSYNVSGNVDLKYPTITNQEIGWRKKINSKLNLDIEVFYSQVDNFVNPNVYVNNTVSQQLDNMGQPVGMPAIDIEGNVLFENYDLEAEQFGAGFTLNYEASNKFKANVFGTIQKTNISGRKNIDYKETGRESYVTTGGAYVSETNYFMNPIEWGNKVTPTFFGGFSINYIPTNKWGFSTDGYIYSDQKFEDINYYYLINESQNISGLNQMKINSTIVLNAKTSFRINKNTTTNLTLKNILGKHTEYGFADSIGRQLFIGLNWNL